MVAKRIITALLLIFVVTSVSLLIYRETRKAYVPAVVMQSLPAKTDSKSAAVLHNVKERQAAVQVNTQADTGSKTKDRKVKRSVVSVAKSVKNRQEVPNVVVYYFHGNSRCYTCKRIESLAHEIVSSNFANDIQVGRIVFRAVNVEEPANEHFVGDFLLTTRSVVLARYSGGKQETWKNLDRVWMLVRDPEAFQHYVADEIRQLLKGA